MRKKWKVLLIASILLIILSFPIIYYFYWLGLFNSDRQTVEIERIWTTEDEKEALIFAENLDYWTYLNITRYEGSNTTELKHPSDPNYIDHQVIEDGKKIISHAKRPFNRMDKSFEYMAICHKVDILRLNKSMDNASHQIRIELYDENDTILICDMYWDYSVEMYDDSWQTFPQDLYTAHNQTTIYHSVFVVRMETMLDSHNKRWDMGGGDGVDQMVILDGSYDPLIIITQKIRIVV